MRFPLIFCPGPSEYASFDAIFQSAASRDALMRGTPSGAQGVHLNKVPQNESVRVGVPVPCVAESAVAHRTEYVRIPVESAKRIDFYNNRDLAGLVSAHIRDKEKCVNTTFVASGVACGDGMTTEQPATNQSFLPCCAVHGAVGRDFSILIAPPQCRSRTRRASCLLLLLFDGAACSRRMRLSSSSSWSEGCTLTQLGSPSDGKTM